MDRDLALAAASAFETPVAVVDEDAMERNLARMAGIAAGAGLRLRPHAKTHKSAHVARRQLAHGAVGLTVATLTEAELLAGPGGVDDLLVAHPPAGEGKLRRLAELASRLRRLAVSLDDIDLASRLPPGVDVLWEVDTGLHRVGTEPGRPTVAAVQRLLSRIDPARFRGLISFGGHVYNATAAAGRRQAAAEESAGLTETAALLREAGIEVRELSAGSTPTVADAAAIAAAAGHRQPPGGVSPPRVTEVRPGTYVYGDANQVALGSQRLEECALAVVATIVSRPAGDRVVADSGSKSISTDLKVAGLSGHGLVVDHPGLEVSRLSEEHAVLTGRTDLRVGDRVVIVPAHACTTVNLHPALLFATGAGSRWEPVVARGWQPAS